MDAQPDLFDDSLRRRYDDGTYPDGFWDLIDRNMHLYRAFVDEARKVKALGFQHYSARMIIYVLRHHTNLREGPDKPLKVNDHWSSGFSRLSMAMYPAEFDGFFEKRTPPAHRDAIRLDGSPYLDSPQ